MIYCLLQCTSSKIKKKTIKKKTEQTRRCTQRVYIYRVYSRDSPPPPQFLKEPPLILRGRYFYIDKEKKIVKYSLFYNPPPHPRLSNPRINPAYDIPTQCHPFPKRPQVFIFGTWDYTVYGISILHRKYSVTPFRKPLNSYLKGQSPEWGRYKTRFQIYNYHHITLLHLYEGHPISSDNGLISQKLLIWSELYYHLHVAMDVAYCCLKYGIFIITWSDAIQICKQHCASPWPRKFTFFTNFLLGVELF